MSWKSFILLALNKNSIYNDSLSTNSGKELAAFRFGEIIDGESNSLRFIFG